ncbi:MAG: YfhO family protein [Bacteroidota bacterium]
MANPTLAQRLMPHLAAFFIILLAVVLYFLPQLQGRIIPAGDIVSYESMAREINDYRQSTGDRSLWTNSMFGGMPTYQIDSSQPSNVLNYVEKATQLFTARPIGYFFSMAFLFYFLMLYLGASPWLSIIGGLAFGLSAGNMTLFEAGHMTKLRVIATFSLMVIGMLMVFRKDYLRGSLLFALGLGLSLYANHVQMTYYFFLGLGVYVLTEIAFQFKSADWVHFGKAFGFLALGTLLGVGSSASKLWTTYEYGKDTMRGAPILESSGSNGPQSSSETDGLEWEYAMQWSNGTVDLFSVMIPGVAGGSTQEELGSDSQLYQDLKRRGANVGNDFRAPLYWGSLPFTSGPNYFGAVFCFLFILGLLLIRGPLKWWLGIVVLLMLLASMGKHFALLNRPLFDYFPLFNKFRTPNSILVVAGFFVPILGVYTVSEIMQGKLEKEKVLRNLYIALGISGGICLFFALVGPSMFDFSSPGDARLEQRGYNLDALAADRQALMRSDALRSLALILATGGLLWAFVQQKLQASLLLVGLGVLAIGDTWMVAKRYVDEGKFETPSRYENRHQARAVDNEILKDTDPHFRVFDLSINTFNDASSSFFHKTIGGYNAAKLQRFQDMIDYHLTKGNQGVLAMLNTKYVITQEQQAQRFPGLGNAWTVSSLKMVDTPNEEIDALTGLEPDKVAVVHQEYADYLQGLQPSGTGTVQLADYRPNHLSYQSKATSEELAVFSEVWYGPDKGWQAYIDGQAVDHIRVNYLLRALKIPAGEHQIEFKFEPSSYYRGETITLIFSLLILLGSLAILGLGLKDWYENPPEIATPPPAAKKPAPKTKAKRPKKGKK